MRVSAPMLQGIDHAVILVSNLDDAIERYTRLGFHVVPGGRHAVATHNALIAFADGAYIELIAFWEDVPQHRWHRFQAMGGGLVDYCMRTDDVEADVAALRRAGIFMTDKAPMSRLRPDGYRVEWALSLATDTQGVTPFLIEDSTPREERVPRETEHANGVTGIEGLTIVLPDLTFAQSLAPLLGDHGSPIDRANAGGRGLRLVNGSHAFEFVEPASGDSPLARHLAGRQGEGGVFELSLRTSGSRVSIEPAGACNARLRLV